MGQKSTVWLFQGTNWQNFMQEDLNMDKNEGP